MALAFGLIYRRGLKGDRFRGQCRHIEQQKTGRSFGGLGIIPDMSIATTVQHKMRFTSKQLGRDIVLTDRDLRTLRNLYTFLKVDFRQLCQLEQIDPDKSLRFKQRLEVLQQGGFIFIYGSAYTKNPIYTLIDKGLKTYLQHNAQLAGLPADQVSKRRLKYPRNADAERIRQHETGVAALAILCDQTIQGQGGAFISHRDLQQSANDKGIKAGRGVPVVFSWEGTEKTYRIKPDYKAGGFFTDRTAGANTRYFANEFDCHSEDVDPNNPFSGKQNIARKLYLYQEALESGLFKEFFGIDVIKPMFVFLRPQRRDHVVEVAEQILHSSEIKKLFHFGVVPNSWESADYRELDWINGAGKCCTVAL